MRKSKQVHRAAWLQGYRPDPLTPSRRKGEKEQHVSAESNSHSHAPKNLYKLLLTVGIFLLIGGIGIVAQQMFSAANTQRADKELQSIYDTAVSKEAEKAVIETNPPEVQLTVILEQKTVQQSRSYVTPRPMMTYLTRARFLPLLRINSDVIGWLTIQDVLDLPVVQRDNSFYLTHNFQGQPSYAGTLFLDQNFSIVPPHENLLIHGHNMRNGSMFGQLLKYREKSFYTKHWLIQFETLYENGNYVVFAAFDMVNDISSPDYYPFSYSEFETDVQFENFIAEVKKRSLFQCDLSVLPTDTLLTLSTCANGSNNYLVIVARKIRDGESLSSLTMTCLMSAF